MSGLTDTGKRVVFENQIQGGEKLKTGDYVQVKIDEGFNNTLIGTPLDLTSIREFSLLTGNSPFL